MKKNNTGDALLELFFKLNFKLSLIVLLLVSFTKIEAKTYASISLEDNSIFTDILVKNTNLELSVKGKVTDGNGEPIPGVNIIEKGTTNGVISDIDGNYSIIVSDNATLVFSSVGFVKQEIAVNNKSLIDVTLKEDISQLDEVVVVGYTSKKRANITGAVADLNIDKEIGKRPIASISSMLQGNIANLNVSINNGGGEPGATTNINIRGQGTLTGNGGSPYILLDGIPISAAEMNSINPYDVENVSVLKDAAAASIYGSRAAYGVILITTKKGRSGKLKVNYNSNFAFASPTVIPEVANSLEWALAYNDAWINQGSQAGFTDDELQDIRDYMAGSIPNETEPNDTGTAWKDGPDGYANNDWYDIMYKDHTPRQQHMLSLSGGTEKTVYYLSGSYYNQLGNLRFADDKYNRYNVTLNLKTEATKWLRFDVSSKIAHEDRLFPSGGFGGYDKNIIYHAIPRIWPTSPLYGPDGQIVNTDVVRIRDGGEENYNRSNIILQGAMDIEPIENWVTRIVYNYGLRNHNNTRFELPAYINQPDGTQANRGNNVDEIGRTFDENKNKLLTITSNYKKTINNVHNFDLLVGYEQRQVNFQELYGRGRNFITLAVPTIGNTTGDFFATDELSHYSTRGVFASMDYNFNEKYLLGVKVRSDESSFFRPGKRKGVFPSISGGYVISKEGFWKPLNNTVNFFKLRASWGQLGNHDPALANRFVELLGTSLSSYLIENKRPTIVTAPNLISPDLTWETVTSTNFGFDAGMFDNKLVVQFELFDRTTTDMIGPSVGLPAALGTDAPTENNASLKNTGWELAVTWNDKVGEVGYKVGFNIGDNRSKVTKYTNPTGALFNAWREGEYLGEIWGYETVGIYQTDDEANAGPDQTQFFATWGAGDIQYADLNGDGKIDPGQSTIDDHGDLKKIGNSTPRYNYGISLGVDWKGFSLTALFQGIGKRDIWLSGNTNLFWGFVGNQWQNTITKSSLDYWRPDNTDAYFPKPYMSGQHGKNQQTQTRYLQNGAYFRLKNIQLSYSLPTEIIGKIGLNKLQVYFSGDNLFTITDLNENFDPEATGGAWGGGKIYPLQKVFSFGVNIGL